MSDVSATLRRLVIERATNRCEYCCLSQDGQEATFHIDHITPVVVGRESILENLALACVSCSLRKGARQTANDPETGQITSIFHPRRDEWANHFAWDGVQVTAKGRATVILLDMNRPLILAIRREEALLGRHPPPCYL